MRHFLLAMLILAAAQPSMATAPVQVVPAGDVTALRSALAAAGAAGGGEVDIPGGAFPMPSAALATAPIFVPNNVTIQCAPDGTTDFTLTGTGIVNNWFIAADPRNVWFRKCGFRGNGRASPADGSFAGAILFHGSRGAAAMLNFGCEDCRLTNFSQPYWVHVVNDSPSPMRGIRFSNLVAVSVNGNNLHPSVIGFEADVLSFLGQTSASGGTIADILIDGLDCDATYIKKCVSFYDGVSNARVDHARATGCGSQSKNDVPDGNVGSGSYCFLAYLHIPANTEPTGIHLTNITCTAPNSACFYAAVAGDISIDTLSCSGQFDAVNAVLPKGCVALNEPHNASVSNVQCIDSYICVESQNGGSSTVRLSNITARGNVPNATGIWIAPLATVNADSRTIIDNPSVSLGGRSSACMIINSNATAVASNPGTVQLNGGTLGCGAYDLQAFDTHYHGGAAMNGFDVNGTLFNGDVSTFAIFFPDVGGGGLVTPLKFTDVTIDGAGFAANARGLHVAGAGNVTIEGLLLKNKTNAGVMLSARGARGSFSNIRFQNVAADSMGGTD